ncbi:MAG TPA: phage holin family protein [Thermoanaerobaculia bacterium]|nr:phage holin family protein [Thermoanaerobaculia bacterium]
MRGKTLIGPWIELVRGLGQSYLDLLVAEWEEIKRQLALSGRRLAWSAAFFGAAAAVAFWLIALGLFLAVAVLHIWLPWWAAALIVTAVAVVKIAVLGWLGLSRLKRLENPVALIGRRKEDHLDWWDGRLLAEERHATRGGVRREEST